MTVEQLNRILFWTIMVIAGFSVWLVCSAKKYGRQLAEQEKAKKSAKSAKKIKASKGKEAK